MSPLAERERVQWVTAQPLWPSGNGEPTDAERERMLRPALLRIPSDDFMADLSSTLDEDPARLVELEAKPESFRMPPPGKPPGWRAPLDHLKLYQAAHGHFNVVAGALVCPVPGLPDRSVAAADGDRVSFVLRRLGGAGGELAWVHDGTAQGGRAWREIAFGEAWAVAEGEERLPMFPLPFRRGERARRLFVGLLPTSSTETFKSAGVAGIAPTPAEAAVLEDPRLGELDTRVLEPLAALARPLTDQAPDTPVGRAAEQQKVEASRFVLLDLAELMAAHAPATWEAIRTATPPPPGSHGRRLYDLLDWHWADGSRGWGWRPALVEAWAQRDRISGEAPPPPSLEVNLDHSTLPGAALRERFGALLPPRDARATPAASTDEPYQAPKLDLRSTARYAVRCVYERPQCGPLHPPLLSERSQEFAIASFFDLDAPARSIHVALPVDTSIKDLRKAPHNVTFLLSNQLRQQMGRARELNQLLKGQLASGESFDLGLICSFSIPIITICALIVLMIFISLLNIVFWWLPFFRICFPIPLRGR